MTAKLKRSRTKISGHNLKKLVCKGSPKYTHQDSSGMLWRFVGNRPVSALADKVMRESFEVMKHRFEKIS